jgi:NAD(P)-dependent dehydrogenase (short-subunit alcohol dehydrogenase family)
MDTYTLITGATSGIGLDLAVRLSGERNLILVGRNEARLDELINQTGGSNKVLKLVIDLDADRRQAASRLTELIQSEGLQIEALVHCAGTSKVMPLRQADTDSIDTIFNVNILSAMELIRPLLKKENKGSLKNIVLISSLASIRGEKGNAVYAASKGALNALTISLAKELAPKVRVNSISPGTVETPMTQDFLKTESGVAHLQTYPLGVGHPEDITNLTYFLLSDETRWITGQNIVIDGGRSTY